MDVAEVIRLMPEDVISYYTYEKPQEICLNGRWIIAYQPTPVVKIHGRTLEILKALTCGTRCLDLETLEIVVVDGG